MSMFKISSILWRDKVIMKTIPMDSVINVGNNNKFPLKFLIFLLFYCFQLAHEYCESKNEIFFKHLLRNSIKLKY